MILMTFVESVRSFDPKKTPKPSLAEGLDADLVLSYSKLEIEIGCGVGLHPIKRAALSQESLYIAIEHTRERYGKFERRVENLRAKEPQVLPNLKSIHANAISWISHHIGPSSVDHYWIMYPNPYPKKKHLNQRWYAMPFTHHLVETLKPGGKITLVTNMQYYADGARESFTKTFGLVLVEQKEITQLNVSKLNDKGIVQSSEILQSAPVGGAHSEPSAHIPRTHFEKKYLERGETCYDLTFQKPFV